MDREYPDYPRHDQRRSQKYHSATSPNPSSPFENSETPTRPEPTASRSPRDARERRRSERRHGSHSKKRSIPHSGATCGNTLCDSPDIAIDERLCPGPEDLNLCSRCYKRFKIERRRAREASRAMNDNWRRPAQRHSMLQTAPAEDPRRLAPDLGNLPSPEQSYRDLPLPVDKTRASQEINYGEPPPAYEKRGREYTKQSSSQFTPISQSEKRPGTYSISANSLKEYDRQTSQSPRKHRSHRGRDDRRHVHNSHARDASGYDEAEFYKYGRVEGNDDYDKRRCCCSFWSRRRKCVVFTSAVISAIILIIIIALAVTLSRKKGFKYVPSTAQVNNTMAFDSGGATRKSVNDTSIGIGNATDSYTYYQGNASNFPSSDQWVSFKNMWEDNLDTFKNSCGWLHRGDNNTPEMIQDIYDAIQDRANASLVDHRIILATIIQETNGCPLNPDTTSSGGTRNPGLMQSHDGHAYNAKYSRLSIFQMVQDGTQGTEHGWGLVDNLNVYGNPYKAMRGYNSGYIPASGNLSEKAGATACYVSDIANRLTGWVRAESQCPDDAD